jgi:hypothetical protein
MEDPEFELVRYHSWEDWFKNTIETAEKLGIPPEHLPPPARLVETLGTMPTPPWEEK